LLTDPMRRRKLASAALARAHREFTVQVMADRYSAMYRQALEQRSRISI
jgi:hypothetical protein